MTMLNFKFFIFSFLILNISNNLNAINCDDSFTNYLNVKLDKERYVLNEKVIVHLSTDKLLDEEVRIIPNYQSNVMLMICEDCLNKTLGPNRQSVDLTWVTDKLGSVIVYFTVEPVESNNTINLNVQKSFFQIPIGRSNAIFISSEICGWSYFFCWILSMYPQVVINFCKKSVIGLNFDYVSLSLVGYSAYAIYNTLFYYADSFKNEYFAQNPHSGIPVALNDVFFSIHGVILTLITVLQCFFYERGDQKISHRGNAILCIILSPCVVSTFFLLKGSLPKLDYIYFFSYVKIILTIGKYIPQALFNYKRKSTKGWSIENCILDLIGGLLSILQMLFLAVNYGDIKYFTMNLAKLFVGGISCTFDILFITQHYILYRHSSGDQEKGSNASFRLDSDEFDNSSSKQADGLNHIHSIHCSINQKLNENRKTFGHCICGNKILNDRQNVLGSSNEQ